MREEHVQRHEERHEERHERASKTEEENSSKEKKSGMREDHFFQMKGSLDDFFFVEKSKSHEHTSSRHKSA